MHILLNKIIGENYEETVKNIANWAEKIDWSSYLFTGAKANCTQEELVEKLQNILVEKIKQNNTLVSFSKMTFPHHLMRVLLLEQIYRGFCINSNITYHK